MPISQGMSDISTRLRQGQVGKWAMISGLNRASCGANSTPQRAQVATIVVDTATNSATYTWAVNGVTLTYVADASATKIEIAAGIVAAIQADPVANARNDTVVSDGVDTVTITGLYPNDTYDVSDADAKLTSTVTVAADSADPIPFGRAVICQDFVADESERIVSLPVAALFTAQVQTITVAYVASAVLVARVWEIRGTERELIGHASVTSATDQDTTLDALITALNANLAASTVDVTADDATATALVFTAEVPGREFEAEIIHSGGGASAPAITPANTTGPDLDTSLHRAWAGISLYDATQAQPATGGAAEGEYAANAVVSYGQQGPIWVKSDETVTVNGPVYVETVAGATCGRFYAAASATRVRLSRELARWDRDGLQSSESLAVVRLLSY